MGNQVTISVRQKTFEQLKKLKPEDITWDEFLLKHIQEESEIIVFPDTIKPEDVLTAIDKVKPPSKWSDMLKYFIIFTLAGTGLGLILPW